MRDEKRSRSVRVTPLVLSLFLTFSVVLTTDSQNPTVAQENQSSNDLKQSEEQRTNAYAAQLETHLRKWLVEEYAERSGEAWNRDYDSIEAFTRKGFSAMTI